MQYSSESIKVFAFDCNKVPTQIRSTIQFHRREAEHLHKYWVSRWSSLELRQGSINWRNAVPAFGVIIVSTFQTVSPSMKYFDCSTRPSPLHVCPQLGHHCMLSSTWRQHGDVFIHSHRRALLTRLTPMIMYGSLSRSCCWSWEYSLWQSEHESRVRPSCTYLVMKFQGSKNRESNTPRNPVRRCCWLPFFRTTFRI